MKIRKQQISEKDGEGSVTLVAEEPEDMWHLYNLVMSGVCCYHYKFFVVFAGGFGRWLHDPKQPMDKAHHTSLGESLNKTDVGGPKASVPDPVEPPKSADMELEETELESAPECSGDLAGGASADGAS